MYPFGFSLHGELNLILREFSFSIYLKSDCIPVSELFASWKGGLEHHRSADIWEAITLYVMCTIWTEWNHLLLKGRNTQYCNIVFGVLCMNGWL